jgi:hypothetical protein
MVTIPGAAPDTTWTPSTTQHVDIEALVTAGCTCTCRVCPTCQRDWPDRCPGWSNSAS